MARFSDFSKFYDELFPNITPVTSKKIMETPTGEKDIENESKEEFVDETVVTKEIETDGIGTDSQPDNE